MSTVLTVRRRRSRIRPAGTRVRGSASCSDTGRALELERLVLQELAQAVGAELPPDARPLEAAERRLRVEPAAVDVDLTRLHPPRERDRGLLVRPEHAAGQAVLGAVGDGG